MIAALLSLALAAPPSELGEESPLAPDGRRGLGAETELAELLKLFRTPDREEEAFLGGLARLGPDVAALVADAEALYRSRGYFALVEHLPEPSLEDLHAEFRHLSEEPDELIFRRDDIAIAFARMHLDERFRTRMGLLEGWDHEAGQVRKGLAVLDAAADTYVVLGEEEAANVVARVDLSAAILRALELDLLALREAPGWPSSSGPTDDEVAAFFALSAHEDPVARREALLASQREQAGAVARMRQLLSGSLLETDPEVASLLTWRAVADARALRLRADAERLWPQGGGSAETPAELRRMTATQRRRGARDKALEGLTHDPLDDRLAYIAAATSRIVHGALEALSHYDRFLSLRGIRYDDDSTYRKRELTWEEGDALLYVQQVRAEGALRTRGAWFSAPAPFLGD